MQFFTKTAVQSNKCGMAQSNVMLQASVLYRNGIIESLESVAQNI
jgi:hypothetical protein